ncbi:21652_t:CDS:2, partial [Dentiscutata erythropus]
MGNSVRTRQRKLRENKLAAIGNYESENDSAERSKQWKQQLQETLLQYNTPKIEASLTVAKIHNRGEYRANCIRTWAKTCLEEK